MADTNTTHEQQHEEDDDYMGDLSKFIPTQTPSPHPKKQPPKAQAQAQYPTNKKPKLHHSWQHRKTLKQHEEDQKTLENIQNSAIPQSNIGFKLLKQMGYTPGKGVGGGRDEPIGIEIRRSRAGIGREDPLKEKARKEKERREVKVTSERVLMEDFEGRKKLEWRSKRVVGNYWKAKGVIDHLENREVEVEKDKAGEGEEGEGEGEEEEEEVVVTEEDLMELLVKLREEHCYCLFCGCQYESAEALLSNCPGLNEDDH